MAPVLALSLSGSLTKLSVIVSVAALVGVALMALLFFAQARELKRLREWAGRAPERAEEIARSFAASPRPAAPAPRPAVPASAAAAAHRARVAAATSAKLAREAAAPGTAVAGLAVAGERPAAAVAAAALTARDAPAARPPAAAPVAAADSMPAAPARASAPPAAPALARLPSPPIPATAATAGATASAPRSAARTALPPAPPRASPTGQPVVPVGAARASAPSGSAGRQDRAGVGHAATIYRRERTPARKILLLFGGLLAVAVVAVLLVSLLSAKGSTPSSGRGATDHAAASTGTVSTVSRGSLRVAVLNATETDGLAGGVADTLKGKGYVKAAALFGTPAGSYPVTVVEYGSGRRAAAGEVAKILDVPGDDVKAMPASTAPLAAGAGVVVVIGQAAAAQSSSETSPSEENASEGEAAGGESNLGETAAEPSA